MIRGYGHAWPVPQAPYQPEQGKVYKVVVNVTKMPDDATKPLPGLTHAARIINLWAMSGMTIPGGLDLVVIVSGPATAATMNDRVYREEHDVENPNIDLIGDLVTEGGAKVYVCGQSMHEYDYSTDDMAPNVMEALSALSVLIETQAGGYALLHY